MYRIVDIHPDEHPSSTSGSNQVTHRGYWKAVEGADCIVVTNGTLTDVNIANTACNVHSKTTRITKGGSGIIDKSCRGPWSRRLEQCLISVLGEEKHPALGIIDAPAPPEIRDAIHAVQLLHPLFEKVYADSSKHIVLEGHVGTNYVSMQIGAESSATSTLTNSGDLWELLKQPYGVQTDQRAWSYVIETSLPAYDNMRLEDALSVICGSTICYSEKQLHYTYPEGATVPDALIKYVKCGPGAKSDTTTVSRTRGITTLSIDGCTPVATVVVQVPVKQDSISASVDGQALQLVKNLVDATAAPETGAAYFALQ